MAALAGLVVLGVLVAGIAAERSLREAERQRDLNGLRERADVAAAQLCPSVATAEPIAQRDALCDRLGDALRTRVTQIAPDGAVLCDSWIATGRLASIESHADRIEVREALAGRVGTDTR